MQKNYRLVILDFYFALLHYFNCIFQVRFCLTLLLVAALPGDTVSYKKDTIAIPNGQVWLEGDNKKESLDSRHFGTVPIGLLQGVVIFSLNPLKKIE